MAEEDVDHDFTELQVTYSNKRCSISGIILLVIHGVLRPLLYIYNPQPRHYLIISVGGNLAVSRGNGNTLAYVYPKNACNLYSKMAVGSWVILASY